MSLRGQITRFAARDPGPHARIAGFMAHLRAQGWPVGVAETEICLTALTCLPEPSEAHVRAALRAVCCGSAEDVSRFDALFDAYWRNGGRVRTRVAPSGSKPGQKSGAHAPTAPGRSKEQGKIDRPDTGDGDGDSAGDMSGKLVAAKGRNLMTIDLRELIAPKDIQAAEAIATRLGAALRDRRSRRRKAARRGQGLDFRRTVRRSLASGGEPLHLAMRKRPDRPVKLTVLVDVSGSMSVYARPFLAFLAGLIRADTTVEAFLFHTRLVRVTGALRDDDPLRALGRITLLADGMGGGSKIGETLQQFAKGPARQCVDGRSVVVILSDGYDSAEPQTVGTALETLAKRGCRIVWLNPLKGWKDYAPVAAGMSAALPHLDLFAPANTLASLAALEQEFARL